jgi:predicted DNA-binding transcriptional regulator YafY
MSLSPREIAMRADRLLSLLMLLQTRGRQPARKLAEALEVSVRTIYRDLDALSAAGVPVYAQPGPEGGCGLLDSYRTNLTALTRDEVHAIFSLSIPTPLAQIGVSQALQSALVKLAAALPAERQADEAAARQRLHVDPGAWAPSAASAAPAPCLAALHQALWADHLLWLRYRLPFETVVERLVAPYGLVAKDHAWYLVAARDGRPLVYPVAQVLAVRPAAERFQRAPGFDLAAFWQAWCARHARRPGFYATLRVSADLALRLRRLDASPAAEQGGGLVLTLPFDSFEAARTRILGWGSAVEVMAPLALRLSVLDFARQVAGVYHSDPALE